MTLSARALILTLISVIACPLLCFVEVVAFMLAAMITNEPTNPLLIKVASVLAVILIGGIALALPVGAILIGQRVRNRISSGDTSGTGARMALISQVIAGVVGAGVVFVQVYLVLWGAGVCSLDGC